MTAAMMMVALIGGHAFADYAGQGDFMAKAKNRAAPIPGIPFYQPLVAHAAIHGALVAFITGLWWLGLAEAIVHAVTDDAKCMGRISYDLDQGIHLVSKVVWLVIAVALT